MTTFGATVRDAGGGVVELVVDRDTMEYPLVGAHVRVIVQVPCEKREPVYVNGGQPCGAKSTSRAVNDDGQPEGPFLCDRHTNSLLRKGGVVRRLP